ncbi:MAG: mechanosensitive ion channel [Bacteroidales bacterium]|nr:mechanosensitive ion channel [Bacteroidales bacterium]
MLHSFLQTALADSTAVDSLAVKSRALIETIKDTPANELLRDLGVQALHFGLKLIAALLLFIIGAWLIKIVRRAVKRGLIRKNSEHTLITFTDSFIAVGMWTLLIILSISVLGINTTSLAALLAAGGMAIGMALSGTLQNFAGGIMLLLFKPFRAGDFIDAMGYSGTVSAINIVNTLLVTTDNRVIVIPNGALSNANINNLSANAVRRVDISVDVAYGSDADAVKSALLEIAASCPGVLDSSTPLAAAPFVGLTALKDSSVQFVLRLWVKTADYWPAWFYLNETIYQELPARYGIQFPFPQMDVHLIK